MIPLAYINVISEFGIKRMLTNPKIYILTVIRLVVIPLAIGGMLSLFAPSEMVICAVLLYCMPCGLNTVVFVKNANGDCESGAAMAFISNILACLSIPLVLTVFNIAM